MAVRVEHSSAYRTGAYPPAAVAGPADNKWALTLPLAAGIAIGIGVVGALWLFGRPIALFVLSVTLASSVAPLAARLSRRLPHALSSVLVYAALLGVVTLVGVYVVPTNADDLSQLTQHFPQMVERFREAAARIMPVDSEVIARAVEQIVPRIVALLQSTGTAVTVALAYVGIQQIEGHVLTPVIMHSQTHISPALVIIALTLGYSVGGIVGALASIPLFAAIRVIFRHILAPELRRRARASS